jgi:hypothetical protein
MEKEGKPIHLRYCYMTASLDVGESRHAAEVMRSLGIKWQHSTPQTLGDQFWFWSCENIPESLPKQITIADWNPMEMIGWGYRKKMREK